MIAIRVKPGAAIGMGHLMRMIAVAEECLAKGQRCVFVTESEEAKQILTSICNNLFL